MRGWWKKHALACWKKMAHASSRRPLLPYTGLGTLLLLFLFSLSDVRNALPMVAKGTTQHQGATSSPPFNFTDLVDAYKRWDQTVGCSRFKKKYDKVYSSHPSLQDVSSASCDSLQLKHVTVHIKKWTWLPDNLENLYSCACGLACTLTKSEVLADDPDALLFESVTPPLTRHKGEPLRAYLDLEAGRKSSGYEDIFISYHAADTLQATYAGSSFHVHRSYFVSPVKKDDVLVYWSSSRCVNARNLLAREVLSHLPHHSFGKCLNNVGGQDAILRMYPECTSSYGDNHYWAYHLHCAMSHYKFVLAIENTMTESYVTEKLFYALDAGAIPIYFGAPNVLELVPPHSIIDGSKFKTIDKLITYVKRVANDPVLYAEYHAWRRCGVMGNYYQTRAVSLDSLPCRLCATVSKLGGKHFATS